MPISENSKAPHFVLVSSAGMGHLNPMTRLAAALSTRGCDVTFVSAQPTVSLAESNSISQLLSSFPKIKSLNLPLVQLDPTTAAAADPFFLRFEAIGRSADNLPPLLLEHLDSISAIVIDISLSFGYVPVAKKLNVPCYMLFTTCAALFSLFAYFPTYCGRAYSVGDIEIPGALTIHRSSVIPFLHDPNHLFTTLFLRNSKLLPEFDGVLINTFEALEPDVISAIREGHVVPDLPPVISVGPLLPLDGQRSTVSLPAWLDRQPQRSVVYVSFGNRTAMTREQIRELGIGLERSGCRFLWVVKTKVVDRHEEGSGKGDLDGALGEGFLERVGGKGVVVNGWIEQTEVLAHPAVGGFVSHCGWNSVTEAATAGMRMLGWPRIGDQRVNGEVVRRSGLGVWMEGWSWEAEEGVVSGEEIGEKVREMMEDEELRRSAERVGEEAKKAVSVGGTSDKGLEDFIGNFLKV